MIKGAHMGSRVPRHRIKGAIIWAPLILLKCLQFFANNLHVFCGSFVQMHLHHLIRDIYFFHCNQKLILNSV